MTNQTYHPVWDVYDLLRTARLNVKYYSARIATLQVLGIVLDLVLGVAAPASAVAGLWLWDTAWGQAAWKWLAVVAAVVAVVKPLLGIETTIQKMKEALTAYKALDHDLARLAMTIKQERAYSEYSRRRFDEALARKGVLVGGQLEYRERKSLKRRCQNEVIQELPANDFYVPPDEI